MDPLQRLTIISFGLRQANPLYDPNATKRKGLIWHKGRGKEKTVALKNIISSQGTIDRRKTASMTGKLKRGTYQAKELPTLQRLSHGKFFAHDGNHRTVAHVRAGKRVIRALVQ